MNIFNLSGRSLITLLVLFSVFSNVISSQDLNLPELPGFRKEINYPVYTPDDLWDYINGAAESYNSFGFVDLNIAEYIKGRKNIIKLEVYRLTNKNMAFGIYALERAPGYNFNNFGVQGYSGTDHIHFFKGNFYIKISTHSKSSKAVVGMEVLAGIIDQQIEGEDDYPALLGQFPKENMITNEEMYISENVLGHRFLHNAFKANYSSGEYKYSVYLFTDDEAESIPLMAETYLSRLDLDSGTRSEGKVFFKDGYNGYVYLAWKNRSMVLINGLPEEASDIADRYINHFIK